MAAAPGRLAALRAFVADTAADTAAVLRSQPHAGANAQAELYFRGGGLAIGLGLANVALLTLAFVGQVPDAVLAGWLAAFVAVRLARIGLSWLFQNHRAARSPRYWIGWMLAVMTAQGLCWGAASWVLMAPGALLPELVLHFALIGIAGSAIHVFSVYPMLVVYTLSILAPLVLRDLWIGGWHLLLVVYPVLVGSYVLRAGYRQARLYAQAEQAHAAKVRFFAAASHDLRQPLHALGLYAQAMHKPDAPAEVRALSAHIAGCVDGMAHIVDELLELSRLDAGSVEPQLEAVPLAPLLLEAAAMHRPAARAQGLELALDLGDAAAAHVHTDPRQVRRVLANLLANALRYTPRGEVRIVARLEGSAAGSGVRVAVEDTGIGIAPAELPRVFEEFYQVGNAGRDRRQGHGLGLAIVKRLSDLLGLDLRVESTPGRGSRFSLRLALAAAAGPPSIDSTDAIDHGAANTPATPAPPRAADPLHGCRVLLIEDDEDACEAMALTLRQWGCEVRAAAGTDAALATMAEGFRPTLVVADLRLPRGDDGGRAVQALRERAGGMLPALLVTGDADGPAAAAARAVGLWVLRKPVKPAQLRASIAALLAQGQAQGEAQAQPH